MIQAIKLDNYIVRLDDIQAVKKYNGVDNYADFANSKPFYILKVYFAQSKPPHFPDYEEFVYFNKRERDEMFRGILLAINEYDFEG